MSYDRDAELTERDGCVRTRRLCKSNRCVWYPSVLTLPPVFFEVDLDPWDPEEEGDGDGDGTGDSAASAEVGAVGDSAADANEGKRRMAMRQTITAKSSRASSGKMPGLCVWR